MATIQEIQNENEAFIKSLNENKGKLFKFLRTMARFHRHDIRAQVSIGLHAPDNAVAYAPEDIWNRMGYSVSDGAKGIEVDLGGENPVILYEVSSTNLSNRNLIWRFDKRTDERLFDGLEPVNGSVPEKVVELCRSMAHSASISHKDEAAVLAAAVVLNRLGYDYRNVAADISAIKMDDEDLVVALANAGEFSRDVLDKVADYVKKGRDEEHVRAANSHFRTLVRTEAEVFGRESSADAPSNDGGRDSGGVPDGRRGGVQPGIPEDSGRLEEEVGRSRVRETGDEPDGVAGADERSEDVSQRDDAAGSVLSVEEAEEQTAGISFEEMRDVALEKAAFLNSDITNQRIYSLCEMANNPEHPYHQEAQKQLRLAYVADEAEVREAHEKFIDTLRDHVLKQAAELDSFNTNEHISAIFERSKNENNTHDVEITESLIPATIDELRDFSDKYLDYLIYEGLSGGEDIERRKQELREADQRDGLSMDSPIVEYFRLRRPEDELAQELPPDLTFNDVLRQMREGRDFESITGIGDSVIRQAVFRQIDLTYDNPLSYSDLYEMDRDNYFNRSAEASQVQAAEEENTAGQEQEADNEEELVSAAATEQDGSASSTEEGAPGDASDAGAEETSVEKAFTDGLPDQDGSVGNMDDEDSLGDVPAEEEEAADALSGAFADGLPDQESSIGKLDDERGQGIAPEKAPQADSANSIADSDTIPGIDQEEEAWRDSWTAPNFSSMANGRSEQYAYNQQIAVLEYNYRQAKFGENKENALRVLSEYSFAGRNISEQETLDALNEYRNKLVEFASRRLEEEKTASTEKVVTPQAPAEAEEAEAGRREAFTDALPEQEKDAEAVPKAETDAQEAAPAQEDAPVRYKYYLDMRPAGPGSVPQNFESIDANDPDGRYGAIYYTRPLTAKEISDYELTTELDMEEVAWRNNFDAPDFDNLPNGHGKEDSKEYLKNLLGLDLNYDRYKDGKMSIYAFNTLATQCIENASFYNSEVNAKFVQYIEGLQRFAAQREEYNRLANGGNTEENAETVEAEQAPSATESVTEPTGETETAAATVEAEPLSPERSAEIQAALDSNANANTKEAFRKNLLAIRTMKEMEATGRIPTEEEIALMRSYVGFGGLREQLFQEGFKGWESEQQELREALTEAEYDAVRASTLTAFYTPPEVVEAIYKSLENIGFEKGNILDPSMGSGRFFQNMPENMRRESNLFGVELDPLTGRMAKFAYPEAEISINGFEKTTYPDNSFDLAITNVPFGDYGVYDTSEKGTFKIHDYFIAKMIEQVRPGGIVAVVTSAGTMDKDDQAARKFFATKAELMDAVRLPVGAFRSAGTQVGTDILLFRKRQRELTLEELNEGWIVSKDKEQSFSDYQDHMQLNAYFDNNPEQVLGKIKPVSTQFGFTLSCVPDDNTRPLGERITEAFGHIRERYVPSAEEMPRPVQIVSQDGVTFSFYIDEEDRLMFATPNGDSQPRLTKAQEEKIRAILPLRNQIRALIDMEKDSSVTDAMVMEELGSLNRAYDSYYEKYGSIALDKDLKKAFHDDISYPLMCSIEKIKFDVDRGNVYEGKGDIFSSRIIVPHVEPDHADSALDALSISILEHGKVDLPYMQSLTGQSQKQLLKQLENMHIYYDDEKGEYVHADEYLSGDIRGKIEYLEGSIEKLQDELRSYASEKVLPDASAKFVPRNEAEENIVNNPYKYIRVNESNSEFAEKANAEACEYIKNHLDDRAFAPIALNYLYHSVSSDSQELRKAILDRYGNELSFVADARREGYNAFFFSDEENRKGFAQYEALRQAMETTTWGKHYEPKHIHNFVKEKILEYQGHEDDLLSLKRSELNREFEAWIEAKEAEVESFAENNLSDKRIKNLMDRINLLEQKKTDLEKVKPIDVKADEINVGLGTTWLPPKYIEDFMKEVFDMSWQAGETCKCLYVPETGTWSITNKTQVDSALVEHTYGYSDSVNALHLLEQALNFKSPTIYKLVEVDGEEKRVPDVKASQIAQQKQDIIKEEFKKWIFKDKDRTQDIVDYYNRHFNSLVPRKFNGEALTFPGMNPNIKLRDHQKNAIAHTLYGGNALFAHAVGAGKTFEMVASAMESKRLGLASKSMIVVPNHLTEQFGAEFKQLYPDANVLVATANDFKKDKRKEFCAKIATYNWDAVVIGTTQFERIPMSQEYMEHSLMQQVNELVTAMQKIQQSDADMSQKRFSVRNIETMKKKIEARLEKLRNSPKDSVVRFEDLGIDRLYVDEAHEFKNLFTYTKMSNVAGVSTTDAQKTTDLYEKVRYLNNKTGEKGVIFATGTPVSNSMTELYTMMRYLEPSKLKKMDIDSFDAWASTFGETTTGYELRPEGKGFQRKTRFAKFNNMPELMALFQEVADIKTQDMLNLDVPEAEYVVEKLEPSQEQKILLDTLVERAEAIHKGTPMQVMTKDGAVTDDNFLWITTEGKKLALDQRLLNPMLPDDPNSKVNKCVENVLNEYKETTPIKGAQLIFCDMSTPTNDGSFNVYDDIKAKLIEGGVKESEVAFIHDAKDEDAKAKLFAKVRSGDVRVLLGSTKKMGTGTNVQDLLVASHDLDVPWRPADLEQRAGRTIRQGNKNKKVKIYRYVTEGTFDAYLWQTLENKQRFISQVMTSKSPLRTIEDCDETTLSYAEIKAVSIGNPLIKEKLDNDNEISRLMLSKSEFIESRKAIERDVNRTLPASIKGYEEYLEKITADVEHAAQNTNKVDGQEVFKIKLNDKTFGDRKEAGEYINKCIKDGSYRTLKGEYKGMSLSLTIGHELGTYGTFQLLASHRDTYNVEMREDPVGNMTRLEHRIQKLPEIAEKTQRNLDEKKRSLEIAKKEINRTWPMEDKLNACLKRAKELDALLLENEKEAPESGKEAANEKKSNKLACSP